MRDLNLMNWIWKWIWLATAALVLAGCSKTQDEGSTRTVTLATTTSTRDSGLLDVIVPKFEAWSGIEVKVVAVGSGQALELGRRGDADVLLTHAPQAERQFMSEGHGETRRAVMHNDFILVGAPSDPARVVGQVSITDAVRRIAHSNATFISRGDESGTHRKEKHVWRTAGIEPQREWYVRAGAGMAEALRMASEKQAYALSDRATFLAQRAQLDLTIVFEGDPLLQNPYAVIVVSAEKHPHVKHQAARRFAEFLLSPDTQAIIGQFGVERFGQRLFVPRMPSTGSD